MSEIRILVQWLAALYALSLCVYPLGRWLFSQTPDSGHAAGRLLGIVVPPYLIWVLAHLRWVRFTRPGIVFVVAALGAVSWGFFFLSRRRRTRFPRVPLRSLIAEEAAFLAVFGLFALIRAYNPDIFWSESSMDMSFLTSLMRTHYMPPPDVWFAGATVNYYHYGHMVVALVAKLSATPPQFAYNLGMATAPGIAGLAVFSAVYHWTRSKRAGVLGVLFAQFMGNLDAVLFLAARWVSAVVKHPERLNEKTFGAFELWLADKVPADKLAQLAEFGFFEIKPNNWEFRYFRSAHEVIPNTVHEFPFWTSIFMDLHAHLLVMPFACTLFFLESFVLARGAKDAREWSWARRGTALLVLGMALGILIPTNSWDFPVHALLLPGAFVLGAWWKGPGWCLRLAPLYGRWGALRQRTLSFIKWVAIPCLSLPVLALLFAKPHFDHFFRMGMGIGFLPGNFQRTGVGDFLTVHLFFLLTLAVTGLFLFVQNTKERGWSRRRSLLSTAFLLVFLVSSVPFARWTAAKISQWPSLFVNALCERLVGVEFKSPKHPSVTMALEREEGLDAKLLGFMLEAGLGEPLAPSLSHKKTTDVEGMERLLHEISYILRLNDYSSLSLLAPVAILTGLLLVMRRSVSQGEKVFDYFALAALGLVAMVEVVYVKDFYQGGAWKRFNTVFKFYLQAWNLFSIACAGKLVLAWRGWRETRRLPRAAAWTGFGLCGLVLLLCMVFVPIGLYGRRFKDTYGRVHFGPTLDGWAYMEERNPDQLAALLWFWENVDTEQWPPPVVLEATGKDYDYRVARISAHTGLPTLLGWWSHVSQRDYVVGKNRLYPEEAEPREEEAPEGRDRDPIRMPMEPLKREVQALYEGVDLDNTLDLLAKHRIEYVYVGDTERRLYDSPGLRKFDLLSGLGPWERVFHQGSASVYKVDPSLAAPRQRSEGAPEGMDRLSLTEEETVRIQEAMSPLLSRQEEKEREIVEKTPPKTMYTGGKGDLRGQFDEPRGIACGPEGRVYVADFRNYRVQCFDEEGRFLLSWGEGQGSKPNQFKDPCAIAVMAEGQVAVADTFNDRIQLFDSEGRFIRFWKTSGHPRGLATSPDGRLLLVSCAFGCAVEAYDAKGDLQRSWGNGRGSGEDQFDRPQGIACGPDGAIYVADAKNGRIKRLSMEEEAQTSFPVDLWNGPMVHRLEPYLWLVPGKGLLCTDPTSGEVAFLDPEAGVVLKRWTPQGVKAPAGIVQTPSGKVLVADCMANRVARLREVEDALK